MNKVIANIKKYIYYITNVIVIVLVALIAIYVFQTAVLKKKYVNVFDYTVFRVATGSMRHEININDIVIVKITKDVITKDVIVFEQDDDLIVHRIIDINGDNIITKGDANNSNDEPINKEQVVGKVLKVIHNRSLLKIAIAIISLNLIVYLASEISEHLKAKSQTTRKDDGKGAAK